MRAPLLPNSRWVPQGSILAPILFIVFINDIVMSDVNAKFVLFADDTSVFMSDRSAENLVSRTNLALLNIKYWLNLNRLTLNNDKIQYMIFHRKSWRLPHFNNLFIDSDAKS